MKLAAIVIFMIGGIALLIRTTMGRGSFTYPLLYPQVMLVAVLVLFAILLVEVLRERGVRSAIEVEPHERPRWLGQETLVPALGLVTAIVYIALWNVLGYLLSTVLFLVAMLVIGRERNVWVYLGIGVVLPILVWFVFDDFLRIPLPGPAF